VVEKCGRDFVKLSWKAPHSDGGKAITGYNIEARQGGAGPWVCIILRLYKEALALRYA